MTPRSRAGGRGARERRGEKKKEKKPEDPIRQAFATTLRKWRILRDKPHQEDLSHQAGLPGYVVGSLERCERPIYLEEIVKICHALEIDDQRFLDEAHLLVQNAAQSLAETLRAGDENEGLKEHRSAEEEFRKAVDLVVEVLKETLLTWVLRVNRRFFRPEAEPRQRVERKRSKPSR
jgi:hypothetical protein